VLDCHAVIGSTSSGVLNMPSWYFTLSRLIWAPHAGIVVGLLRTLRYFVSEMILYSLIQYYCQVWINM
jgi:hypothetical protein